MVMLTGEVVDSVDSEQDRVQVRIPCMGRKTKIFPHILLAEARNIVGGLYLLCPSPLVKKK